MKRILAALVLACAGLASAQTVALQGMMGNRALLIVDGEPPRAVAPGDTHKGVKVLSTMGDQALVEIDGKRHTLRVGDTPASVGGRIFSGGGRTIVLTAGTGGHFFTQGTINGRSVQFMVDTGATGVALSVADAERIGLNYKAGRTVNIGTANGVTQGWIISLSSVRIGDVEVHGVEAAVSPGAMPYVLLGNSYLTRFQMRRENDQMVLERRY
jgi:aspartyl protease family protein